jgi:hypothetical protein
MGSKQIVLQIFDARPNTPSAELALAVTITQQVTPLIGSSLCYVAKIARWNRHKHTNNVTNKYGRKQWVSVS